MLNCDSEMLLSALQSIEVPPQIPETARSLEGARVALFYRAGEWEKAHNAAQDLETLEGSFWHGILHRHEGDWGNAAYWFRRVGRHPVYPQIRDDASDILGKNLGHRWQVGADWDPLRFIDWCKEAASGGALTDKRAAEIIVTAIQAAEWRRLFAWCIS